MFDGIFVLAEIDVRKEKLITMLVGAESQMALVDEQLMEIASVEVEHQSIEGVSSVICFSESMDGQINIWFSRSVPCYNFP